MAGGAGRARGGPGPARRPESRSRQGGQIASKQQKAFIHRTPRKENASEREEGGGHDDSNRDTGYFDQHRDMVGGGENQHIKKA